VTSVPEFHQPLVLLPIRRQFALRLQKGAQEQPQSCAQCPSMQCTGCQEKAAIMSHPATVCRVLFHAVHDLPTNKNVVQHALVGRVRRAQIRLGGVGDRLRVRSCRTQVISCSPVQGATVQSATAHKVDCCIAPVGLCRWLAHPDPALDVAGCTALREGQGAVTARVGSPCITLIIGHTHTRIRNLCPGLSI